MNTLKVEVVIPDWVNWITVDKNGERWGYENEPEEGLNGWFNQHSIDRCSLLYLGIPPKNWKEELYTWK